MPAEVTVRPATAADLDPLVAYEIEIARISFGDEAVTDPALHRRRVAGSLGKPDEVALVAVRDGAVVGWVWLSGRTNSLTGDRYGNLRSLATSDVAGRGAVAEQLLDAALDAAARPRRVRGGGQGPHAQRGDARGLREARLRRRAPVHAEAAVTAAGLRSRSWSGTWTARCGRGSRWRRPPRRRPEVLSALDTLAGRGILVSVASRNPASVGEVVEADPALAGPVRQPAVRLGPQGRRAAPDRRGAGGRSSARSRSSTTTRSSGPTWSGRCPRWSVLAPEEVPDALGWPEFDPGR